MREDDGVKNDVGCEQMLSRARHKMFLKLRKEV
jgi:hypothetical protein